MTETQFMWSSKNGHALLGLPVKSSQSHAHYLCERKEKATLVDTALRCCVTALSPLRTSFRSGVQWVWRWC